MKISFSKFLAASIIFFLVIFFLLYPRGSSVKSDLPISTIPEEITYEFGDCPVRISGVIYQDKNSSTLTLHFHNLEEYPIAAIKVVVECYNVYGEKIGKTITITYQKYCIEKQSYKGGDYLIYSNTKSVNIYTYNVYFKSNCHEEWGYRNLSTKLVIKNAPVTCIEYLF